MDLKPVQGLRPFQKFCMSIGALPSSYKESMDYLELLMWFCNYLEKTVIPTINNNADCIIELQQNVTDFTKNITDLFNNLKNFVEDYFINLDLQTEINNKLDEMASDGSLYSIMEPYFNNFNTRFNELNNKIDSFGNGSPLAVTSINEMVDTSRIYVNTSNGKWYYFNNSDWVIGGVYQSSELSNNSVPFNVLSSNLQESFSPVFSNVIFTENKSAYINILGNIISKTISFSYFELDVNYGDNFYIDIFYSTSYFSLNNPLWIMKDSEDNVIYSKIIDFDNTTNIKDFISIPKNVTKLFINSNTNYLNGSSIIKINNYIQNSKISYNQLDSSLKNIFELQFNTISANTFIDNAFFNYNGSYTSNNSYEILSLDVKPGEKYKINTYLFYNNPAIYLLYKDSYRTISLNNASYNVIIPKEILPENKEITNQFIDIDIEIPFDCFKIYINKSKNHSITIQKATSYKIDATKTTFTFPDLSILNDKTLLFSGDSITYGAGDRPDPEDYSQTGWVKRIQELNPNANIFGYGISGSTIAKISNNNNNSILERIDKMFSEHQNADYIILQGGVNDTWNSSIKEGSISNGYSADLDEYTFCGAMESLLKNSQLKWKGKKIGFIITFKVPSSNKLPRYMNLAKQICEKWSVPYLDLFNNSNLNYYLDTIKKDFSQGDGLHPNGAGYDLLTNQIDSWIKSL